MLGPHSQFQQFPAIKGDVGRRYPAAERFVVLVVDPDQRSSAAVAAWLDPSAVDVVTCAGTAEALFQAGRRSPDLTLLSAGLDAASSCEFLRIVRRHDNVPVVLGVGEGETERVGPVVLAGASEVLNRPYTQGDIQNLIQRHLPTIDARRAQRARLSVGAIRLDGPAMALTVHGRTVTLPLLEFELLRLLMTHADRVVTYEEIQDHVWRPRGETVSTRTISVHIYRLRRRLDGAAELIAVRGIGYRLAPCS